MKEIKLKDGRVALVDEQDFDMLNQWDWHASPRGHVRRNERRGSNVIAVLLHRVITGAVDGQVVDHIDGNPLNNCRSNLRICSHAENMRNRKMHSNNKSGYKGVRLDPKAGTWRAYISVSKSQISLGSHATPEDAARAYNAGALKFHGQFARLNAV